MDNFLEGRRLLVLEDDYLVALDVQQMIEDLGGIVVGPVGRLDQARELVRAEQLDGAVLDVNLDGTTSYALARELRGSGVAVVFLTGYESESLEEEFRGVPRVGKPLDANAGARLLRDAFG